MENVMLRRLSKEGIKEAMEKPKNTIKRRDMNKELYKLVNEYGFGYLDIEKYDNSSDLTFVSFKRNKVKIKCRTKSDGSWIIYDIKFKLLNKDNIDIILKNKKLVDRFNEILNLKIARSILNDIVINTKLGYKNNEPTLSISTIKDNETYESNIKLLNENNEIRSIKLSKRQVEYLRIPVNDYRQLIYKIENMISIKNKILKK